MQITDRIIGSSLDLIAKLRPKTCCTHHPKRIFRKALPWITYGTDQAAVRIFIMHIFISVKGVDQSVFDHIIRHCINRKVPSGQIFFNGIRKHNIFWMSAVCIITIFPECGDLVLFFSQ